MSSQLAELYFCSSASWKVELASDETGYLAEKVFKQHVERKVKVVHQLFATPRTIESREFSGPEYWSG